MNISESLKLDNLFNDLQASHSPLDKMKKTKVISDLIQQYLLNNDPIPSLSKPLPFICLEGDQISDSHLEQIAKISLKALVLKKCSNISGFGLSHLKNIDKLVISDVEGLKDSDLLQIPDSITDLLLKTCHSITNIGVSNLKKAHSFHSFAIDDCSKVKSQHEYASSVSV